MSDLRLPEPRQLPPGRLAARRDHLVRELRAPRRRRRRLPRGRRALLLLPIGAALAGGALAATRPWEGSSPTDLVRVKCYSSASVTARYRMASADIVGWSGPRDTPRSPVALCAELWEHGVLGDGGAAPRLQACICRAETVVFPGPQTTCALLGLRPGLRPAPS